MRRSMTSNGVVSTILERLVLGSHNGSANAPVLGGIDTTPPVPFHRV